MAWCSLPIFHYVIRTFFSCLSIYEIYIFSTLYFSYRMMSFENKLVTSAWLHVLWWWDSN